MPRNGQTMMFNYGGGPSYLMTTIPVSNYNIFPVAFSTEEDSKLSHVRALLAESVTQIIRREPNTNSILANIAEGRGIIQELSKTLNN